MTVDDEPSAHEMTASLLDALGEHSGARSQTPQEVWEQSLSRVRALVADTELDKKIRDSLEVLRIRVASGEEPKDLMDADQFQEKYMKGWGS